MREMKKKIVSRRGVVGGCLLQTYRTGRTEGCPSPCGCNNDGGVSQRGSLQSCSSRAVIKTDHWGCLSGGILMEWDLSSKEAHTTIG